MNPLPAAVLIPAYNEADRIAATVRAARSLPGAASILVIDDGSTDATAQAAQAAGAAVLRLPANRGKGAALNCGLEAADAPILLLLDADLGDSAREAARLLAPIRAGEADMTVATFPHAPHRGGFGLVVRLARWGIHRRTGLWMEAPLSGQRALRREVMAAVGCFEERFGVEVALTLDAARKGFHIQEVETAMSHRLTGRSWRGLTHRARQFRDVARALARRWTP
ncbi:MAG: glycosyltransferase family 2 protein [Armatimonadetes bacterium]|nr:glycosyltransferase family 2 protein [Armatimonadota bacterium]